MTLVGVEGVKVRRRNLMDWICHWMSESTLDRARLALQSSPLCVLRALVVEQSGESIVISGRVESFYQKQMAQEAIRAVCHDIVLRNTVSVDD